LTFGAGSAAAFSCTGLTGTDGNDVILTLVNESVVLAKGNLSAITANGVPCGGATTSNTETIFVLADNSGAGGSPASLTIDEGGGRFEPGVAGTASTVETEALGLNEIEFVIIDVDNIDGIALDFLTILGNAAPDTINLGGGLLGLSADDAEAGPPADAAIDEAGFINLNGDDDADIFTGDDTTLKAIFIAAFGRGGNDVLTAKGGAGTGGPVPLSFVSLGFHTLTLNGGDGDDSLQGGDGDDFLVGGPGNDVIDGDDEHAAGHVGLLRLRRQRGHRRGRRQHERDVRRRRRLLRLDGADHARPRPGRAAPRHGHG
jgi:Ca2+-binding RTX toxin-like protein